MWRLRTVFSHIFKRKAEAAASALLSIPQKQFLILLLPVCLEPAAQLVIPLQELFTLLRQYGAAAALSAGGGVQQLKAQMLLGGAQHRPGFGVGHIHGQGSRPQGMKFPDPVQKLRDPRPEYLIVLRIEADGHFENHIIHVFIVSAIPQMSMEQKGNPHIVMQILSLLSNKHTFC